ncbi:MAG: hypothetical protein ACOVN0_01720 [Niveispirillum sp.]|uniref:hypothetical protein n=1 Tax=Niveispirillum sp. TaxID=1917217 RepID=UPI003BA5CF83
MRHIVLGLMAFLLTAQMSGAQEAPPQTTEPIVQTAPNEKDPGRLICKAVKETGSRMKRNKICKTRQDWDDMRQNSAKQLDDYAKQAPPNPLPSS